MKNTGLRLCSVLGEKVDLLPHFIRHYRALGVEEFDFVLHILTPDDPFREQAINALHSHGIEPAEIFTGQWNGHRGTQYLNKVKSKHPNSWFIVADSDEFHLYPEAPAQLVDYAEQKGNGFITGCLIDRVSNTGKMLPVKSEPPIWEQFPIAGFVSFPVMQANPFKITLCRSDVILSEGQHGVIAGLEYPIWNQVVAQVHHFKWTEKLMDRMQVRIENISSGHWEDAFKGYGDETKKLLLYLASNRGCIGLDESSFLLARSGMNYNDYSHWNQVLERVASWRFLRSSPIIRLQNAHELGLDLK